MNPPPRALSIRFEATAAIDVARMIVHAVNHEGRTIDVEFFVDVSLAPWLPIEPSRPRNQMEQLELDQAMREAGGST